MNAMKALLVLFVAAVSGPVLAATQQPLSLAEMVQLSDEIVPPPEDDSPVEPE